MEIRDFMDVSKLQDIQDKFSNATGLAAIAIDAKGEYLTEGSNFTDFCMKYTRGSTKGNLLCKKCDAEGKGCYFCHAGLMDFSIDIIVNGEKVGAVIGGQVLPVVPDEDKFRKTAQDLGINPEDYIKALRKVPIASESKIRDAADLFGIVVNQMVNLEYHRYSNANHQDILQREIHKSSEQVQAINNNTSHLKTIANRQKIISINASIEAARSGEAGVGFAVVAKSMQDLSSQSAVIYNDIEKSVAEITETISVLSSLN